MRKFTRKARPEFVAAVKAEFGFDMTGWSTKAIRDYMDARPGLPMPKGWEMPTGYVREVVKAHTAARA